MYGQPWEPEPKGVSEMAWGLVPGCYVNNGGAQGIHFPPWPNSNAILYPYMHKVEFRTYSFWKVSSSILLHALLNRVGELEATLLGALWKCN